MDGTRQRIARTPQRLKGTLPPRAIFLSCAITLLTSPLFAQLPVLRRGAGGESVVLLQVALSNAEFSTGAIDGRFGRRLHVALADYQESQGLDPDGVAGPLVWKSLGFSPGSNPDSAFRTITVTAEDTTGLAAVPESVVEKAEKPALPYETVLERLAERHQTAAPYLEQLNPEVSWPDPPPGTSLRVPAVRYATAAELFVGVPVSNVGASLPARLDSTRDAVALLDSSGARLSKADLAATRRKWEQHAPPGISVRVSMRERAVRVYRDEQLIARYPASVGSSQFPDPSGAWRIVSEVYAPDYRFDLQYLETGVRSKHSIRLPPGPNNIVGLLWLGLSKQGYGIHGTEEPETIGSASSHGCVRLANWDVERLALNVGIGTPVTISN